MNELERIKREYNRRERDLQTDFYSIAHLFNQFMYFQRSQSVIAGIRSRDLFPLSDKNICEVGCGTGQWLIDFLGWGIYPSNLYGIELDKNRYKECQKKLPSADIRLGDASNLPWEDGLFDIVLQSTVFTSILDIRMKKDIAREMVRVLNKDSGIILWYDFLFNNPKNPNVKGIKKNEIGLLFPGCEIELKRITLAPPLARKLVPMSWILSLCLEKIPFLCTHYLGIITPKR